MRAFKFVAAVAALMLQPTAALAEAVPLSEVAHIHGIAFDLGNPGRIFLATHFGIFILGPDGQAEVLSEGNDFMGFSPHPTDASMLLASGHPAAGGNMGVIVSRDGGVTWTPIADGLGGPVDFHAMTMSRADPQTLYGTYGGIQVSRDGGLSWSLAGQGPEGVIDLAASASDVNTIYAGTVRGLWMSEDSAVTWTPIGPADIPVTMVEIGGDGSLYAFFAGVGLFRQPDFGASWEELAQNLGTSDFLHLALDPGDATHMAAVTQDGQVLESRDGGLNWAAFGS